MRPQTVSVLFQYLPCSFQAWSQPQIHTFLIAIFTDQKYLIPSFCSPHESSCILFHSSHPCQVQRLFKEEKQYYHRRNYTKVDPLTQRLVFNEGKNRDIPHWASQKTNWNIKSQIMRVKELCNVDINVETVSDLGSRTPSYPRPCLVSWVKGSSILILILYTIFCLRL